jgi:hypothetical protein
VWRVRKFRAGFDPRDGAFALFTLLAALPVLAAVDGVVVNETTSQPQAGATVTLYKLDQNGLNAVESVKSGPGGVFAIDRAVQGPHLVQAAWDGVTYNHMLPPGRPTSGLQVKVWNSSKARPQGVSVDTHMILLEPDGATLSVNESFIWRNAGNLSFNNPEGGTLRFQLPPGAGGKVKVMCTAPQGMPIERAAMKTGTANVFGVDFPIKPGETRIDISYSLPASAGAKFQTKALHGGGPVRIVAPQGVTLKGAGVEALGQEPTTQATIYEVKGAAIDVEVEGTGALRAGGEESGGDEDESPGIQQIRPRVYDRLLWVLALSGVILALTLALVYRRRA